MIHELRIYRLKVGGVAAYLDLFEREGLPIAVEYLSLLGFWSSEYGAVNDVHHLWAFRSLEDRRERRAKIAQDRRWTEDFGPKAREFVLEQQSIILRPSRFSPDLGWGNGPSSSGA